MCCLRRSEIPGWSLSARETVETETPHFWAMSAMVARGGSGSMLEESLMLQ
jgi:hypothetical protein